MSNEKCGSLYEEKLKLEDQLSAIQSSQYMAQNQIQQMQVSVQTSICIHDNQS